MNKNSMNVYMTKISLFSKNRLFQEIEIKLILIGFGGKNYFCFFGRIRKNKFSFLELTGFVLGERLAEEG